MNKLIACIFWVTSFWGVMSSPRLFGNPVEINETVTNGFVHPGIGLTKEILDNARAQVQAQREPWYSNYQALASDPNARTTIEIINQSDSDPTKPKRTNFNDREIMKHLEYDGRRAFRQALMYFFTGDVAHRANAMTVIRIWSQLDPESFDTFHASHIHTPYAVKYLVSAAELMRYTDSPDPAFSWTEEDTENLTNNLIIPSVETYMYSNGLFMNQNGYPIAGSMACFIFMNDRENYEKRVEWFTVNKDAPNKGYSSSIQDLFRLVEVNAETKKRVKEPFVQLMEMGRDQAHSAGDLEIACTTARMMNAQGTKVDPKRGTVSTDRDAVGVYEFLDNRILAAADYFSRFMLGYDTPWTPSPSDMEANGKINQIYYRLSDNYRGRIRDFSHGDLYYYYTYQKGVDVGEIAPYYLEAFQKRIKKNDFEWLYIPPETTGEGARVIPTEQEPDVVDLVARSTHFGNATVMEEDGYPFLRMEASPEGKRLALLSIKTPSKTIGLNMRSTGVTTFEMEGFKKPWLLPNTNGKWRYVVYTMSAYQHIEDIVFARVKGAPNTKLDFAQFVRKPEHVLKAPVFVKGDEPLRINTYVGVPITLDFSAKCEQELSYHSSDQPAGSQLDEKTGIFTWLPQKTSRSSFIIEASNRTTISPRQVVITVLENRSAAMKAIRSAYDTEITYTQESLESALASYQEAARISKDTNDTEFWDVMLQVQENFNRLEPLTPQFPDGSVIFPALVVESNIGDEIGFLIDGNDDTFPTSGNESMSFVFDFGENYQMSFTSFSIEGRVNFDDRTENTVFYGSNDRVDWIELTDPTESSEDMVSVRVSKSRQKDQFRYFMAKRQGSRFFEPAELRIFGTRHDAE